jgi:predicted TIM-barrel fold metal-dependent hydrolase
MKTFDANLILGKPAATLSGVERGQRLIAEMDRHNVDRGLVTHLDGAQQSVARGNQMLFEQTRGLTDRLVPVPVVNLGDMPDEREWRLWRANGVRGVRICPQIHSQGVDQARTSLLKTLESLGWFLQIPLRLYYMAGPLGGNLKDAAEFASLNETVKLILCGVNREQFVDLRRLLESTKNVHLDVGNLCRATYIPQLVNAGFAKRLVCGSGFGISYLTPYRDVVLCADISAAAKQRILYENGLELVQRQ